VSNYFHKDLFLNKYLGKNAFCHKFNEFQKNFFLKDWKKFLANQTNKNFFVFSKVNTTETEVCHSLENANFRLIDTNVNFVLNKEIKYATEPKSNFKIRFADKMDRKTVAYIAKKNFNYSRFHLDPLISNKIANQIKLNWAQNFFNGLRGDYMIVAVLNKLPVGFLQLILNKNDLIIDLIAVEKRIQGKGIASSMIHFAQNNLKCVNIIVGTQISNVGSINLYNKLGFELHKSFYVFHYHN
tara:strand:+ start:64 stop:786 length:723 start_codon:yes stop_codon:yes gene_type:complete